MDQKKQIPYNQVDQAAILVCRVIIVIVSLVSIVTTAIGLQGFVFDSIVVSGAISLVVQLTLLVFDFTFPKQRKKQAAQGGGKILQGIGKTALAFILAFFYAVVLVVSSGFSYVYISNSMYDFIWTDTVQQVVLQEYRKQVFENQDYVEKYLAEDVTRLNKAIEAVSEPLLADSSASGQTPQNLPQQVSSIVGQQLYDLTNDRFYLDLTRSAQEAQNALSEENSASIPPLLEQLSSMQTKLEQEIETLKVTYTEKASRVDTLNQQLARAQTYQDTLSLTSALNVARQEQNDTANKQTAYERILDGYKTVQQALNGYQGSSVGGVKSAVYLMQSQMLKDTPEIDVMLEQLSVLTAYAQEQAANQSSENFTKLASATIELQREMKTYQALRNLQDSLEKEVASLSQANSELEDAIEKAPAGENSELKATQDFWRARVENLRDQLTTLPAYQGDNPEMQADRRTESAAALDELVNVYLVENTKMRNAYNYLVHLHGSHKIEACVALYLAFLIDLIPFGLNWIIAWIKERAVSRKKA